MDRVITMCTVAVCLVGCARPTATDRGPARDESSAKLPAFLRDDEFTCATFAQAVNHYVGMGEVKAIAALRALAVSNPRGDMPDRAQRRMAFVCRALFEPKAKGPLRAPMFGGLSGLPDKMPPEKWPLYPVVRAGASYFVLGEAYALDGLPEWPGEYLDYCRTEGSFRKDRLPVPTRAQALRDFESLRDSGAWKSLKWKDRGPGFEYTLDERSVLEYLKAQAERIPAG